MKLDISSATAGIGQFGARLKAYAAQLTLYEKLAWGAIVLGVVLVIVGLVLM